MAKAKKLFSPGSDKAGSYIAKIQLYLPSPEYGMKTYSFLSGNFWLTRSFNTTD